MKHRPFRGVVETTQERGSRVAEAANIQYVTGVAAPPKPPLGVTGYVTFPNFSPPPQQELRKAAEETKSVSEYIIWNPASPLPPKVIQNDRGKAISVAGRMAHENPGATFYVCKLVHSASKPIAPDVKYTDLDK
jgi:hypothetical protein